MTCHRLIATATMLAALALALPASAGAKSYSPGASDSEIRIGNIMPYSGPASAYGAIGKAEAAYFAMVNDEGGINGRKIRFISRDDGYSPPRAVQEVRRLVEEDHVLLVFQPLGTPSNIAIRPYLNARKVPQLFVASGATQWGDPQHFPWTMGGQPSYQAEARIYVKYLLKERPDARIAILYQNDDYGRDYLKGIKDALGDKAARMIVAAASYEVSDPTIDSQIITLKASGADTFFNITTPKFAAQAIRKAADIGWHPLEFLNSVSNSVGSVLKVAGLEKSTGLISTGFIKDPTDPQFRNDPAMVAFRAFMAKYDRGGDPSEYLNIYGYTLAQVLAQVLRQCGDDLTRDNVMRQAAHLDLAVGTLQPGVRVTTSPTDYFPFKQMRLERFDGTSWVPFGAAIGS